MTILRFAIYIIGLAILVVVLTQLETSFPGILQVQTFVDTDSPLHLIEYSPLQVVQLGMLLICGLLLALVARNQPSQRPVAFLFGGIALAFLIRESEYFLDSLIGENFWLVVLGIALALVIAYTLRNRRRFSIAWGRIWPSPGISLLFAGSIVVTVFATLVGQEGLWRSILGDSYLPLARRAVEEFMELTGYSIWLVGTIEYAIQANVISSREPRTAVAKRRAARRPSIRGRF